MVHDPSGTADAIIIQYSPLSLNPFVITIPVYILPLATITALWYNRIVHGGTYVVVHT